jgi:1,4-dihydroxy-2-naphthoate octaprenyltransferase
MTDGPKAAQGFVEPRERSGKLSIFLRLTRAQFLPLIILPVSVGTALAYSSTHSTNAELFGLALAGSVFLHLGANAIDDCYDYENGVDSKADSMFPKDFEGWKPIPRNLISLPVAKALSFLLLGLSLSFGVYLSIRVGYWALILGLIGVALAYFYTAPPLKLDYRGIGLGELAIFAAFGPVPVLGSYYVQTGILSMEAFLISIPIGIMTVTILLDHDLIFFEVYRASKKLSLTTVLGRKKALKLSFALTIASYVVILMLAAYRILPVSSILAPLASAFVLFEKWKVYFGEDGPPPLYASFTLRAMLSNWTFSLLLALALAL